MHNMAKHSHAPTPPTALADQLLELLYRYGDLLSAQYAALRDGNVSKASMLGKSSDIVLAQAYRTDRRLGAARAAQRLNSSETRDMDRRLQSANSHVRELTSQLGRLLANERSRLLKEIGQLDPNGASHGPGSEWAAAPTVLNIRT